MVVADAIIHGDRDQHLSFNECEHPVALQLGGSDPKKLVEAVKIAQNYGYDEFNLNVGCPSDRVKSGSFGACLMETPEIVAECIAAMKAVTKTPVTVKCRIGVDDQDPAYALPRLAKMVHEAGSDALWVHARKAWLQGLSPKENRDIPPLEYERVYELKKAYETSFVGINGGIATLDETVEHLKHCDGVMMGREAYHNTQVLRYVDQTIYGASHKPIELIELSNIMAEYAHKHVEKGGRVHHVTRHMLGLFNGYPNARRYRQMLSMGAQNHDASADLILEAFEMILNQNALETA
jgi:tRNA-dihydrouridine synthase A